MNPERWQHIDDVKVELEELKAESDSQSGAAGHPVIERHWRWLSAALIGIVLVPAGVWVWRIRTGSELPPPQVVPLTSYPGQENGPSFSPDGNQTAFAWNGEKRDNWDIWVKVVGETHALRLTTDPAPDVYPAWSPDGTHIAFCRGGLLRSVVFT